MMREWWAYADCNGRTEPDPALPDVATVAERRRVARWYCLECPVRPECAADALDRGDVSVIRGGLWLAPASTHQSKMTRENLRAVVEAES